MAIAKCLHLPLAEANRELFLEFIGINMSRFFVVLLLLLPLGVNAEATEVKVSSATQALYERMSHIQSMSAYFVQKVTDHEGWLISEQSGQMQLQRPNKIRWHSRAPQEQLVVGDGQKLWLYDPDLEQVTVYKNPQMLEGPMTLLAQSQEALAAQFAIAEEECELQVCYVLKPRKTDNSVVFTELHFEFSADGLEKIVMLDRMRQRTETVLSNRQFNIDVPKKHFSFEVPDGADVVVND